MKSALKVSLSSLIIVTMLVCIIPFQAFAAGRSGWVKNGKGPDGCYEYKYYVTSTKYATGWKKIDGAWYYFRESDGRMVRDRSDTGYEPGVVNDGGNFYYFAKNGKMMFSKWVETGYGWTYLNKSGAAVVTKGWRKINKKWYYFRNDASQYGPSTCLMGMFLEYDGHMYYFDDSCKMVTGWMNRKVYKTSKYYASTDTLGTVYYSSASTSRGAWFYFASGGEAVSGWKKINKKWYYFYSSGYEMAADCSVYDNGKTYYFDASGACKNP